MRGNEGIFPTFRFEKTKEGFSIFRSLFKFVWFLVKWGLVPGVIAAAIAIPYLYRQIDEGIRSEVEGRFASHYSGLSVRVRSAARVEGRGVEVRGLSIREPGVEGNGDALVEFEELFIECETDLGEWIKKRNICARRITLRRPTFRATLRQDGSWSIQKLLPLPNWSETPPEFIVENGTIEVIDETKSPASTLTFQELNLKIVHRPEPETGKLIPELEGTATGDHLHSISFCGKFDKLSESWSLGGVVENVDISNELGRSLPGIRRDQWDPLKGFRGYAGMTFQCSANGPGQPVRFQVAGHIKEGRLDDPRAPLPLTKIRARFCATNEGLSVESFLAKHGQTDVSLSCYRLGYGEDSLWSIETRFKGLELNHQIMVGLPEEAQKNWRKYWPSGRIDIHAKLTTDGRSIDPSRIDATVSCRDISFCYSKFPYRLKRGIGEIRLRDNRLTMNLSTYGTGEQPIRITSQIQSPMEKPFGWTRIEGLAIPVDKPLLDALDPKYRSIVESFNPHGYVDVRLFLERKEPEGPLTKQITLDLLDGSIRFRKFPYPLEKFKGKIERFADGSWLFSQLQGKRGAAEVRLAGQMVPAGEGQKLTLSIAGNRVSLDEDLRKALPLSMQKVWGNLNPKGVIDLKADLGWEIGSRQFDLNVVIDPQTQTTSIEPTAFPYQLEKLQGQWIFEKRTGRVHCDRFRASHGQVTIAGAGYSEFSPNGMWRLHLRDLSVDRLRFDQELIQALPGRLRKGLFELKPNGPMSLHHSSFDISRNLTSTEMPQAAWDMQICFQQASLDCGIKAENMYGNLALKGDFDGNRFWSRGELDVDSLTFKGLQFTNLRGPIWIDNKKTLFGNWVANQEKNGNQPQAMTAELLGGTVKADGWVSYEGTPQFVFDADLLQADLTEAAKTAMPGVQKIKGRIGANLSLHGIGRTVHGLGGKGSIWLRDADIYELPVMISLLKILRIQQPDTTAFSRADMNFAVKGPHIYFPKIDFNGDAISLVGQGEMDFQSGLDLSFYSVVGRNEMRLPILSPLLGEASRQAMTVRVTGTVQDPKTSREVLPGVRQALEQLEAELQGLPESIQR